MSADNRTASGRTVVIIGGMSCESCVRTVTNALSRVPGTMRVEVDLGYGQAVVAGNAEPGALGAAVEKAGYDARLG